MDHLISLTVPILVATMTLVFLVTRDIGWGLVASAGLAAVFLSQALKPLLKDPRPEGAENCGAMNTTSNDFGSPSSHSAAAAALIITAIGYGKIDWFVGLTYVLLVSWARINCGCHSLSQVTLGTAIGGLMGLAAVHQF